VILINGGVVILITGGFVTLVMGGGVGDSDCWKRHDPDHWRGSYHSIPLTPRALAPAPLPCAHRGTTRSVACGRVCARAIAILCLNVTCVQCENGKSISPIDSDQPTMAHDADTDSDLARPPDGKHPSARNATPAMLLLSATRRRTAGHVVAHPGPSDSE
jgi:hypothetical protein